MLQALRSPGSADSASLERARPAFGRSAHVLVATILALTALRVAVAGLTGLTEDEAYYRLWALAPAMGYLDHPPMVGWMMAAGRWIAGDTALGLRLPAVLTSLIGAFAMWRTAAILFGPAEAQRAVWLSLAMPLLAAGSVIMTPDVPSVLFWGLAGWALAELYTSGRANWWLAVGLFAGLGLLSKYTNLFVGMSILLWLVMLRDNWRWFRSWQLWAGGAVAFLCTLPVVLWNAEHEWASFAKQFGRVVSHPGFTARYLVEFCVGYLGLASPVIAVLGVVGAWRAAGLAVRVRHQPQIMLMAGMLPFLVYLIAHALHDRVQANWAAPLYPSIAVCAALALGSAPDLPRARQQLYGIALGVGFGLSALLHLHVLHPLVHLPGSRDPSAQMRGWPELSAELERLREANGARWIATSNYATTGQLAFAFEGRVPVVQLTERLRYVHLPPVDEATLRSPALYAELERRSDPGLLSQRFNSVVPLGTVTRRQGDVPIATYRVYRVAEPVGTVSAP